MGTLIRIGALSLFSGSVLAASYFTYKGVGVSTPKVVKETVREGSVGHRRFHGGHRYGK